MAHAGWSSRIEYEPGTGALAVFPSIHLETCDEPVASVQATVELETSHIGKGCDRDTYSEKSLHRLCGKEVWCLEPSALPLQGGGSLRTTAPGSWSVKGWVEQTQCSEVAFAALLPGFRSGRARGVCRLQNQFRITYVVCIEGPVIQTK